MGSGLAKRRKKKSPRYRASGFQDFLKINIPRFCQSYENTRATPLHLHVIGPRLFYLIYEFLRDKYLFLIDTSGSRPGIGMPGRVLLSILLVVFQGGSGYPYYNYIHKLYPITG